MTAIDKIGLFMGKPISKLTRQELLEFAEWAGKRIEYLERVESETEDFRLHREVLLLQETP